MKPDAVDHAEQGLGVQAKASSPVTSRGYALGDRRLIELADRRTVLAKRAIDQATADSLRAERRIYDAVVAPFLPRFPDSADGPLPLLALAGRRCPRSPRRRFLRGPGRPPPPGAPSARAFQLARLEVALPWAIRSLGLPRPEAPP